MIDGDFPVTTGGGMDNIVVGISNLAQIDGATDKRSRNNIKHLHSYIVIATVFDIRSIPHFVPSNDVL